MPRCRRCLKVFLLILCLATSANAETVVVYGSSLIEYGPLVSWLQEDMPNDTVINAGMAGQGSRVGVSRFENMVMAHRPDRVLIEFLINDSSVGWGIDRRECGINHRWMVEKALLSGAQVYLLTPNLPMNPRYWPVLRTTRYYEEYDELHVTNIKPPWPRSSYQWYPDGIHPNDAAWNIVYDTILSELRR